MTTSQNANVSLFPLMIVSDSEISSQEINETSPFLFWVIFFQSREFSQSVEPWTGW
jgi:hypothetical protein